jgi:quercetin dioxygenase-like cupin family protein
MVIQDVLDQLESAVSPVVKLLQKAENSKVVVMGFKSGMVLKEHQTNITTKLVIVDGKVIYKSGDQFTTLNKFDELEIPVNVPHSVEATEDSICFLIQG